MFSFQTLEPDPILWLKRIVGFGGSTFKDVSSNSGVIIHTLRLGNLTLSLLDILCTTLLSKFSPINTKDSSS